VPPGLADGAPLVVVLHGCTQTAASYDAGAGWSKLADERGFALLFPEQRRANNANLCFNWFSPEDASRGGGEALSISRMVLAMQQRHRTNPTRTFVTGLSAGGAMSAVMLATYPELFAGGAVIAGLPFGTATTVPEAFDRMRGHGGPRADALGELVRNATSHGGPWPTLSVWHGSSDATVVPSNARDLITQWRALHGVASTPSRQEMIGRYPHRIWCDSTGREVIEEYQITGMAHGTPLSTGGAHSHEVAGPHMLEAGISSTRLIARFWGLTDEEAGNEDRPAATAQTSRPVQPLEASRMSREQAQPLPSGVAKTIDDALRAAGLLR
jgi:poly(hydroxyalkanoate) depolymerase family esterase